MAPDIPAIRRQFPFLDSGKIVYLDSAATAQKPQAVLDAMDAFAIERYGNPHRGMHPLAESATVAYEGTRARVAEFIGATRAEEIIFTKNCTEAINLVAKSWGGKHLRKGDVVVLTILEHHSNIVPWLQLKEEIGIELRWIDCDDEGQLILANLDRFLAEGRVKLVAVTAQSNVLGVRPPLETIIPKAHATGALVLIDAAQSIAHHQTNAQALDCDFLAFSGHKFYGPTGIGVLYGKREHLETMPPLLSGGGTIQEVTQEHFTAADIPARFEGGTQPVIETIGLHAAIDWLSQFSWNDIEAHERELLATALEQLQRIPGLTILGPGNADVISGCASFTVDSIHPHDLTEILGRQGICLRAGHHCAQPLHRRLGIAASTRLSVGIYNTLEEIDAAVAAVARAMRAWQERH